MPRLLREARLRVRFPGQAVTDLEEQELRRSLEGSSSRPSDEWKGYGEVLSGKGEGILRLGAQNFGGMASKSRLLDDERESTTLAG
jgi:hypothetical protein